MTLRDLSCLELEAATRLGETAITVLHWEKGQTEPPIEAMPQILSFLGYDPFPEPRNLSQRLLAVRRANGWTIKEAARQLGADEGT
jgi:transcriptional regulator with XRE-family HTH domain